MSDISKRTIQIHERFSGEELLLYGARNEQGDLVVVVRGPEADVRIRRKEKIAGMWMHVESRRYGPLPLYYAVGSTKPLDELLSPTMQSYLGIGAEHVIAKDTSSNAVFDRGMLDEFSRRHWYTHTAPIRYFGETLFRTTIPFPDSLAEGDYTVISYLVRDGNIVSSQTIPLRAYKTGVDAWLFSVAHHQPWFYGIASVLLAIGAGWFANRLFAR
ncbi:MAG: TIGR02186 family protein [Rickettsiales bacterium]